MSEPLVELLEAELHVGSHPFRFLAPKDLARVAAASRAFHGGFDYGKVRGLVATYVSDVCEALDLQRSARTDHGEPWWSWYRAVAPHAASEAAPRELCGAGCAPMCVLYALLATPDLASYFRRGTDALERNDGETLGSGGALARQLRKVFAGERAAGDVFAALKAARPDVGEAPGALLGALLDVLHHDLNLFRGERETLAWFYDDKKSDEVNAKGAADVDASLDLSIVRDVFLGRLMRTHRPAADPGAVATKDFGGFLVLPVPDGGPDLAACLARLFEEPEPKADVEFHGVVGDGFVKTRLCVAPEHLVLQVPAGLRTFPARNLDLAPWAMPAAKQAHPCYDLYAVVGNAADGSPVSVALDAVSHDWVEYAPSRGAAAPAPPPPAGSTAPALLFYRRRDATLLRRTEGPPIKHVSFYIPKKRDAASRAKAYAEAPEEQDDIFAKRMADLESRRKKKPASGFCAVM